MDNENTPPPLPFRNTREESVHLIILPQEIIEEGILTLLPVKSLLRFKCVSKSCHQLIGSDRFIEIHRQRSIDDKTCANWMVLSRYYEVDLKQHLKQCSRRSYVKRPPTDPLPLEGLTNKSHSISGELVDSCNGLLCILKQPGCFTLFNSATRISNQLPELDIKVNTYGFGWDETTDAYKVVVVRLGKHNCITSIVYSTKTNAWKTVNQGFPAISACSGPGQLACGRIHWVEDTRIESFDLKREVFGTVELPCKPMYAWLCTVNECLGLWSYDKEEQSFDLWVMKECGVKESWVKWPLLLFDNISSYCGVQFYFASLVSPF